MIDETTPTLLAEKVISGAELTTTERTAIAVLLQKYDSIKGGRNKKYASDEEREIARKAQLAEAQKKYRQNKKRLKIS